MQIDRIYLDLNELDKENARIKKQIIKFNQLDKVERREVREMLQDAMKMSKTLQTRISRYHIIRFLTNISL